MTRPPKRRDTLRAAVKLLRQYTDGIFDSCKGVDCDGFVCGDCPEGNEVCERKHAHRVKIITELQDMARHATAKGKRGKK